jgi:hypothetical protein
MREGVAFDDAWPRDLHIDDAMPHSTYLALAESDLWSRRGKLLVGLSRVVIVNEYLH